jgi:hypothetical protein
VWGQQKNYSGVILQNNIVISLKTNEEVGSSDPNYPKVDVDPCLLWITNSKKWPESEILGGFKSAE